MNTFVLVVVEHPEGTTADGLIDNAIKPYFADVTSDSPEGWSVDVRHQYEQPEVSVDVLEELKNRRRDKALRTALSLTLSDFPEDWSNEQVIEGIVNGDENVLVWERFENWDVNDIAGYIEDTAEAIYSTYF